MSKWTPGPWTASEYAWPEQSGCPPLVGQPFSVCRADLVNVAAASTIEDARLIAAAPDLAEALENALAAGLPEDVAEAARAALRRAKGEV